MLKISRYFLAKIERLALFKTYLNKTLIYGKTKFNVVILQNILDKNATLYKEKKKNFLNL